jgi:hypothetical protein
MYVCIYCTWRYMYVDGTEEVARLVSLDARRITDPLSLTKSPAKIAAAAAAAGILYRHNIYLYVLFMHKFRFVIYLCRLSCLS